MVLLPFHATGTGQASRYPQLTSFLTAAAAHCVNSYTASGGTPCASHLMTDSVQSARKAARDVALDYSRSCKRLQA